MGRASKRSWYRCILPKGVADGARCNTFGSCLVLLRYIGCDGKIYWTVLSSFMSLDQEAWINIVEAIKLILSYVKGGDFDALPENFEKQDRSLRCITTIGEAKN